VKKAGSATDPLWYKDAIIYELHVRAFMDSNADGIGDFPGLLSKLDYLQDLGVTCLWMLPFFPSPLRDDGYDIANYVDVNPSYGTLNDFKQVLDAAHQRGMQVMIELVINHTSDQHPWFQRARLAPPGSTERDFYVWSPTDQLFKDARIIFTDTEKSNWTWDETAKAYYWHRFFSHQPDLNYDNPLVLEEVLKAMRFWLDMGVDALRMDAIPYLVERDGTNCENLPETHAVIKKIRAAIDADYSNRLVLAEANQWPTDVRPYFGDGDECHMAFHFPLMPRIYMALRQEDRLPITDIMAQTPAIPDICQWGLFLRNHDELTLEMVTSDERDYMYFAYSADPRMRVNVGIRRRLAPLVDNNRRRIELLNSLLLSFPGTPIIYYGDEIGMGDNIYLGDRNGVRTPMQWNPDRNAGFSTAIPAKLYLPVIMDPIWGYQSINVEAQQSDQSSLLHWTRNMIALRKLFHVFGRGTQEFLNPDNRKILAYIRHYEEDGISETVLCVANLSRFSQPVSLDLARFAGMIPVEMLGYVTFPTITAQPYLLSLAPYSFLWLELQPAPEIPQPVQVPEEEPIVDLLSHGIEGVLTTNGFQHLEQLLITYLPRQRWFGAKSRTIKTVAILDVAQLHGLNAVLVFLQLTYDNDSTGVYQLPLTITTGEAADTIRASDPGSILATVTTSSGHAILHDGVAREDVRQAILELIEANVHLPTRNGTLVGRSSSAFTEAHGAGPLPARTGSAEQSNTSILYDAKLILKLFRRLQPGENPDTEIGRFLTETAHFPRIAPFLGDITLRSKDGQPTTLAMLQGLIENEGDGWQWTLDELSHYYDTVAILPALQDLGTPPSFLAATEPSELTREHAGLYLDAAALLGRRTAEMHLALATPTRNPDFVAECFTTADLVADADRIDAQLSLTLTSLKRGMSQLSETAADHAALVLSRRLELFARARAIASATPTEAGQRIRIHGDYHLGQVLRSRGDYVILDFEGEPARSLSERRAKQSPLKDVAGMLRSFSYAAYAALNAFAQRRPDDAKYLEPWATLWQNAVSTAFLRAYQLTINATDPSLIPQPRQAQLLLGAYLLEKSLYELLYELDNRPTWVRIPLAGILSSPL
jgi:maltose alpha-D-glucosyltransferase/alpha-amylase